MDKFCFFRFVYECSFRWIYWKHVFFFFVFWSSVGFGANCVDLSDLIFIFNFCATLTPSRDDVKVQKQSIDPPERQLLPLLLIRHCLDFYQTTCGLLWRSHSSSSFKQRCFQFWRNWVSLPQSCQTVAVPLGYIWALQPATVAVFRSRSQTEGLRHQ